MAEDLKIKIVTTADNAGVQSAAAALQGLGKASEGADTAGGKLDKSAKEATSTVDALGKKGSAAKDVYEGLSGTLNGGAGAVFNLSKAWSNLGESIRANPVGTALAVLLASLGLVQKGFDYLVNRAEEANQKLFGTGQKTAEVAKKMGELETASKAAADTFKAAATAAADEWERLVKAMDAAQRRKDALRSAGLAAEIANVDVEEAAALANATPAERDQIKRRFDRDRTALRADYEQRDLESSDLQAGVQKRNAQQTLVDARGRIGNAELIAAEKGAALATAEQSGQSALRTKNPELIAEANRAVQLARKANDLAEKNLAEVRAAEGKTISGATDRITAANDTVALNAIKRGTARSSRMAQSIGEETTQRDALLAGGAVYTQEESRRVAAEAQRIAGIAPGKFSGNSAVAAAAAGIKEAAAKIGDNKDEAADLSALMSSLEALARAAGGDSPTLRQLAAAVQRLEAQIKGIRR